MALLKALLASSALAMTLGAPLSDGKDQSGLPKGYNIVPFEYTGAVGPNGENVTLHGTVEDIVQQIKGINPRFEVSARSASLFSRDTAGPANCGVGLPTKADPTIKQGIDYLHGLSGQCGTGPGPGSCARVSCSYGGAIWFCNDNSGPYAVDCTTIGTYAGYIYDKCVNLGDNSVHGQIFDTNNWNVIVSNLKPNEGNC